MKIYGGKELDPRVIPMVEYFNDCGLETVMSCQGHSRVHMSLFYIEFACSVTEEKIADFQRKHADGNFQFCANGHFVHRLIAAPLGNTWAFEYVASNADAADADLAKWKMQDVCNQQIVQAECESLDTLYGEDKCKSCRYWNMQGCKEARRIYEELLLKRKQETNDQ